MCVCVCVCGITHKNVHTINLLNKIRMNKKVENNITKK